MPGHKGQNVLGFEQFDITEIDGADDLFSSNGIIKESENNASKLFNAHTFYSTEGSSLCIKAALFLVIKNYSKKGTKPVIFAGRNAHKSFINTAALLNFDVVWLQEDNSSNYLSCNINANYLDSVLSVAKVKPLAIYVTSPDYLGFMSDIKGIKNVCNKHGILLIVDNAHGAYLNFLQPNLHPISLGADICCDSAHKTLHSLTGGAYLHISFNAPKNLVFDAKDALALFGSTSPSYLILQSLDALNVELSGDYRLKLQKTISNIESLKNALIKNGFVFYGNEPMKITICAKELGYTGKEFAEILKRNNIFVEFCDKDYVVLMPTTDTTKEHFERLKTVLLSIEKRNKITTFRPSTYIPKKAISVREAMFSPSETIETHTAIGKILANPSVACPPAVPIIVSGEIIDKAVVEILEYYDIKTCKVVKE